METNLKKLMSIVGAVCFSMTQLYAAYDDTSSSSNNSQSNMTMAVPPSPTCGESGANVFISADYTLWTARESGLAVAISNYYPGGSATPDQGSVFYPKFKLRSGFKVDLGVYLPHDNWDLQAEYTWFNNNSNSMDSADFTAGNAISTWWTDALVGPTTITYAASKWDNWFNRVDVTMGRSFFAGHYLAVRPFMGLLGAWDSQELNIDYRTSISQVTANKIRNTQKFWGVGVYGGMDSTFTFMSDSCNQWSLFLDAGTALPWSKFTTHQHTYNSSTATVQWFKNIFYTVAPMVEAALGLRWETWWADGAWKFMLQAAWENQVWFNHNNFIVAGSDAVGAGNGAYTMQGLTVKAVIAF